MECSPKSFLVSRGETWYKALTKKALLNSGIAKYTMEELEAIKIDLLKIIKKEGG